MHIHIYYSSTLETNLRAKGFGGVRLVPNEDALLGTVGTVPMVTYNEWGEILNERGEVQYAIHLYKQHWRLKEIVTKRFGWMADVGSRVPTVENLVESDDGGDEAYKQFILPGVSTETCTEDESLCSCVNSDCQIHY